MKATEGRPGRVFILRLDDKDSIPGCIEAFAMDKGIVNAHVSITGGVGSGTVVVGPRHSDASPPEKMTLPVDGAHELTASGIIAPDENGNPILHIHGSLGRAGHTLTGCLREGVNVWLVCEAVIYEILGASAGRKKDPASGFVLLDI